MLPLPIPLPATTSLSAFQEMATAKPASPSPPPSTAVVPAANTAAAADKPAVEQLLEVAEDEVVIDFKPNAKCRADLRLRSLHPSLPVAFKVQTSSPLKFLVSPPRGAVQPLSSASLRVVLRPQQHAPASFPRSRGDRFLVLSSLSAAHLDSSASSSAATGGTTAIRLRVFFGGPYLLRLAAEAGDAAAVRLILRRQPHLLPLLEPEAAVPDGAEQWAPLHAAAARGHREVRRLGPTRWERATVREDRPPRCGRGRGGGGGGGAGGHGRRRRGDRRAREDSTGRRAREGLCKFTPTRIYLSVLLTVVYLSSGNSDAAF